MPMIELNDLLPPDQWESNWTFWGKEHEGLPNQEYVVFEYYCDNPDCDCQNLIANIIQLDDDGVAREKSQASILYDWSSQETACYPTLSDQSTQSELAPLLLDVYKKFIHSDEYLIRIKKQYAHVKKLTAEKQFKNLSKKLGNIKKIRRNDPCPCGSSKKYKKCCLNYESSQICCSER
jgi:hypothetical protein